LSPRAFFQASWEGADLLYGRAVAAAGLSDGEHALDLYCGAGGLALLAARRAPGVRVTGVEEEAQSVEDAEAGRGLGALPNVRFVRADVERFLYQPREPTPVDVIFVDPPRRGLAPGVVDAVVRLAPRRLVYVSCAPGTLGRDLALLVARGYRV